MRRGYFYDHQLNTVQQVPGSDLLRLMTRLEQLPSCPFDPFLRGSFYFRIEEIIRCVKSSNLSKTTRPFDLAARSAAGYLFAAALAFFFIIRLNDAPCLFRCFAILIFQSFTYGTSIAQLRAGQTTVY